MTGEMPAGCRRWRKALPTFVLGFDPPKTTSVLSKDPDAAVVDEILPNRRFSPRDPELNPAVA
jgi:hypothetical protein